MFNIQPGTGLGFTASKEIALGLGAEFIVVTEFAEALCIFVKEVITQVFDRSPVSCDIE